MAQTTSALWKELLRTKGTVKEYSFQIDDAVYGPESEVNHSVEHDLFDDFGIGNAINAVLTIEILTDNIPKAATIKRSIRLRNGETVSEWLPKGTFFATRRIEDSGKWTVTAYDSMCKAEQKYLPDTVTGDWPYPMKSAAEEIAERMGVSIDTRTVLDENYMLQYPNDRTMRQVLEEIAAAHGGNWIITDNNELYLLPLLSAPEETNYLVNEYGDAITFGGVRILV